MAVRVAPCAIIVAVLCFVLGRLSSSWTGVHRVRRALGWDFEWSATTPDTLILFAFFDEGPLQQANLRYFINVGIWPNNGAKYVLVVNGKCDLCNEPSYAAKLRDCHVDIHYKPNTGFDFGAYAFVLPKYNLDQFRYFFFTNAGSRGPVLPRYDLKRLKTWFRLFTDLLNDKVLLVGPTISCEFFVHVQTYSFALNRRGMDLAMEHGVFGPDDPKARPVDSFEAKMEVVKASELGMSQMFLARGFAIESMMTEYAGREWPQTAVATCNNGLNPFVPKSYHGLSHSVFEPVFYKNGGWARRDCGAICDFDQKLNLYSSYVADYVNRTLSTQGFF